jgi:hypothetical protein
MAETAANLVDHVLPRVPLRQFVLRLNPHFPLLTRTRLTSFNSGWPAECLSRLAIRSVAQRNGTAVGKQSVAQRNRGILDARPRDLRS